MSLSACQQSGDNFQPGEWELQSYLTAEGQPDMRAGAMSDTVTLSAEDSAYEPRAVMFSKFYNGQRPTNIEMKDGVISGHLDQAAVAPFPAHTQAVEGWYRSDAFEIKIAMPPIGGVQGYQVVTGKLAKPADR